MKNIKIQTAKDGNPVPLLDGYQLHSLYAPIKEGQSLADTFLAEIEDYTLPVLVLGLGFGYHILPLLEKFNDIYIAESNQDLINEAKKINELSAIFSKCKIIDSLSSLPTIPKYHLYTLRSEYRFAERFFTDLIEKLKISDKDYAIQFNQLRALINTPVYGGSLTTAKYIETALNDIGVCTRVADHSSANELLQKYLFDPYKETALISKLTDLLSEDLWTDVTDFHPHIIFFVAQSPLNDEVMQMIKNAGIVSIYWFVEDFRRFPYWRSICNSFDYFYMIQKGEFEEILQKTCSAIWGWFPVAAEPSQHRPLALSLDEQNFYGADISFMGAAYPNRVKFFKHFDKANLKLWGTGWSDSELSDYDIPLKDERITAQQSNIIYQATKININIHSSDNPNLIFDENQDFINPRTFEIAACKGFQLVDDRDAVRELFDEDKEIVFFKTVEEAIDKAKFYLKNESLRQKIAQAGYEKVITYHTYQKRVSNMINTALQHSPKLVSSVYEENSKLHNFMNMIKDTDFESFINNIPPALRFSYNTIINEIYKSGGELKNHEALLMLLDTFFVGE